MRDQKGLIHNSDWDNLIILDACRYDLFEKTYNLLPNLNGKLQKVKTRGTDTAEFLTKTFPERYEITVFSGTPQVNSKGISTDSLEYDNYTASQHFEKIHDIWENSWDKELGTAPPEKINNYILSQESKLEKKNIIWYLQPHEPHIGAFTIRSQARITGTNFGITQEDNIFSDMIRESEVVWKMLRTSYFFNLVRVLYSVAEMVPKLEGKTVVTSDHGELLGDNGFVHQPESEDPDLQEVPWLEIEETELDLRNCSSEDFVKTAYRKVLGREVDREGLENYIQLLNDNSPQSLERKDLYSKLICTPEFRDNEDKPVLDII